MGSSTAGIDANSWAAPPFRPPGMRTDVPYEPRLEKRNELIDKAVRQGLRIWYGLPVADWISKAQHWYRDGKPAPIEGTAGSKIDLPNSAYRIAVFGDMGEGSPGQARVGAEMLKWAPTHVATTGDNVYPMGSEADYRKRFDPHYQQLRMISSWKPALGNHDYYGRDLRPYFSRFGGTEGNAYYKWSVGQADFFVLDTEQRLDETSSQRAWFERQLAASDAKYRVVQLHRPLVSTNEQGRGENFDSLAPLLSKYGVQLVLGGHEHGYERSHAIDGTIHLITGGGGAAAMPNPLRMPDTSLVRSRRHHYTQIAFDAAKMVVRAVDSDGEVFDSVAIAPHQARSGSTTLGRNVAKDHAII